MEQKTKFFEDKLNEGWVRIPANKAGVKPHRGKRVLMVMKRDYDPIRGYYSPTSGIVGPTHYSNLSLSENWGDADVVDMRDILEIIVQPSI